MELKELKKIKDELLELEPEEGIDMEWLFEFVDSVTQTIEQLQQENERYKAAMNEAIRCINHEAFRTACNELENALEKG